MPVSNILKMPRFAIKKEKNWVICLNLLIIYISNPRQSAHKVRSRVWTRWYWSEAYTATNAMNIASKVIRIGSRYR